MTHFATIYIVTLSIFNAKNELLLVRKKGSSYFQLPGGKRGDGENDQQVLKREIMEELSVDCSMMEVEFVKEHRTTAVNEANTYVVGRMYVSYENDALSPKNANEIEEFIWVNPLNYRSIKWAHLVKEVIYPIWAEKNSITLL